MTNLQLCIKYLSLPATLIVCPQCCASEATAVAGSAHSPVTRTCGIPEAILK